MSQTKSSKSSGKKATDAKAKKALARAEKSVRKARKAVQNSSGKLRAKVAELAKTTEKLEAKHKRAVRELASAEASARPASSVLTPPLPTPAAPTPSLLELRRRAKQRGIAGFSRMNKASLLDALESRG